MSGKSEVTILKKFFMDGEVYKPGNEAQFEAAEPTLTKRRELKRKGKIAWEEPAPKKSKSTKSKPEPEKEE